MPLGGCCLLRQDDPVSAELNLIIPTLRSQFFRNGKTLPVDRKGGVEQPIMNVVASRLAAGDWVHLFPEGRVSYDGQMLPFRRGVGKMVCDCVHQNGRYEK